MNECSEDEMARVLGAAQGGAAAGLSVAEQLLATYPNDARLHFLRGSLLAGDGRSIEAHAALARAVALAPQFLLARFQLGFFELTSGEAARALATWQPLTDLPAGHHLAKFVAGLAHLIDDHFADAAAALSEGIAANDENPPLNRDMQLIVDRCAEMVATAPAPAVTSGPRRESSVTSFLLDQLQAGGTQH